MGNNYGVIIPRRFIHLQKPLPADPVAFCIAYARAAAAEAGIQLPGEPRLSELHLPDSFGGPAIFVQWEWDE
jgi:hypothetical protein